MQAHVNDILSAANAVNGIARATGRALRETDEYPLFYCGGREVPEGNNESKNTGNTTYDQGWHYRNQLYVEANTEDDRESNYEDYELLESLTNQFLSNLLSDGNAEWELISLDYYPANLGGYEIVLADIVLKKFHTNRY